MSDVLGHVLRGARIARRMTQQGVADLLGVSRAAVGQWENGTHEPSTENLIAICDLLRINIEAATRGEFIELDEPKKFVEPGKVTFVPARKPLPSTNIRLIDRFLHKSETEHEKLDRKSIFSFHTAQSEDPDFVFLATTSQTKWSAPLALQRMNALDKCYIVHISSDFLYPKFDISDQLFVSKNIQPKVGEYVVYRSGEMTSRPISYGSGALEIERCAIGLLESIDPFGFNLRHHNPEHRFAAPMTENAVIHRIYPWRELIAF